ncbi:hypothetical protein TomMM35A_18850 [Sphingobium sp. TomMM35A]
MPDILLNYCRSALNALTSQSAVASSVTHAVSLGMVREQLVRELLTNHLPELVTLVSGQIFDTNDARSTQQDAVLVLKSMPRLPFASGIDLIYAEGVVATAEVKSHLAATTIRSVGEGISSIRKLHIPTASYAAMGVTHKWPVTRILNTVVAFDGSSLANIAAVLDTMQEDHLPDIVLTLTKGMLVRNEGLLLNAGTSGRYVQIDDPAKAFMYYLTFLTEITGTLSARGINWRAYW